MIDQKHKQALGILINGVNLAAKRGAYSLAEAKLIGGAVETFVKKTPAKTATEKKAASKKAPTKKKK